MKLLAAEVDGEGEQVLVWAAVDITELEVVMAVRERVAVELDLLGGVHGTQSPAVDLVVQAFHGSGVVPETLEERGGRHVGLLDSRHDLLVKPVLERLGGRRHDRRVLVLGFEMGDDFRVGSLA